MSGSDIWNFRPTGEAQTHVEKLVEEVDMVENRTDAINFALSFQKQLVESGGTDILFQLMAVDDITEALNGEGVVKAEVKEAIRELDPEEICGGAIGDDGD